MHIRKKILFNKENTFLPIFIFSLGLSWTLSFPYHNQVLYEFKDCDHIHFHLLSLLGLFAISMGLLVAGCFVNTIAHARITIMIYLLLSILTCLFFLFNSHYLWMTFGVISSFFSGISLASWGFYYRYYFPRKSRMRVAAIVLIHATVVSVFLDIISILFSQRLELMLFCIILTIAFFLLWFLPTSDLSISKISNVFTYKSPLSKPVGILCLFVMLISINSGFMTKSLSPTFEINAIYRYLLFIVPYLFAITILKKFPLKYSFEQVFHIIMSLMGLSYLAYIGFGNTLIGYITVSILAFSSIGLIDLLWLGIIGELLEYNQNAAIITGITMSANVIGFLLGSIISSFLLDIEISTITLTLILSSFLFILFMFMPHLHNSLLILINNHEHYQNHIIELSQDQMIINFLSKGILTNREKDIAQFLLKGAPYKIIAADLKISENTVRSHVKKIYLKYEVQSRSELINLMIQEYSS